MTEEDKFWFRSYLSEGVHVAFRKASDHQISHEIWNGIARLPAEEWAKVMDFVSNSMIEGLEYRAKNYAGKNPDMVEVHDLLVDLLPWFETLADAVKLISPAAAEPATKMADRIKVAISKTVV